MAGGASLRVSLVVAVLFISYTLDSVETVASWQLEKKVRRQIKYKQLKCQFCKPSFDHSGYRAELKCYPLHCCKACDQYCCPMESKRAFPTYNQQGRLPPNLPSMTSISIWPIFAKFIPGLFVLSALLGGSVFSYRKWCRRSPSPQPRPKTEDKWQEPDMIPVAFREDQAPLQTEDKGQEDDMILVAIEEDQAPLQTEDKGQEDDMIPVAIEEDQAPLQTEDKGQEDDVIPVAFEEDQAPLQTEDKGQEDDVILVAIEEDQGKSGMPYSEAPTDPSAAVPPLCDPVVAV